MKINENKLEKIFSNEDEFLKFITNNYDKTEISIKEEGFDPNKLEALNEFCEELTSLLSEEAIKLTTMNVKEIIENRFINEKEYGYLESKNSKE